MGGLGCPGNAGGGCTGSYMPGGGVSLGQLANLWQAM